jgi:hypothetical protein
MGRSKLHSHGFAQSYCLFLSFVAALFLAFAASLLFFAAFFLGSAAAVLTLCFAALVVARLAAVNRVGAICAVVGGTSCVGASALVVMAALMVGLLSLCATVDRFLGGGVVVASGHAECKSGSHNSS